MDNEVVKNMNGKYPWFGGILYEISPFGTGFIEDTHTGRVYGFHKSMLASRSLPPTLEGALVRFQLDSTDAVRAVDLVAV